MAYGPDTATQPQGQTFASIAAGANLHSRDSHATAANHSARSTAAASASAPSTSRDHYRPRTPPPNGPEEENVYVLTLLTDDGLHKQMTSLRKTYFPARLNKLEAHLTLFHALPETRLEDAILPHLESTASGTAEFPIETAAPFRLRKGIAIGISDVHGGSEAQTLHRRLQSPWLAEGFLSKQDAGGCRLHYTIMNKVDDERQVTTAFEEVLQSWRPHTGRAIGFGLWRYERGFWKWQRAFPFAES